MRLIRKAAAMAHLVLIADYVHSPHRRLPLEHAALGWGQTCTQSAMDLTTKHKTMTMYRRRASRLGRISSMGTPSVLLASDKCLLFPQLATLFPSRCTELLTGNVPWDGPDGFC